VVKQKCKENSKCSRFECPYCKIAVPFKMWGPNQETFLEEGYDSFGFAIKNIKFAFKK